MRNIFTSTPFLAIVACLLWSTAFAGIKIGLQYNLPFQFAGERFFLAGLMILPFALAQGSYVTTFVRHHRLILLISLAQTFVQYALFYWGISLLPAGLTAITVGTQPLMVALLAHYTLRHDRITWRKMAAIVVGISGVVFIAVGKGLEGDGGWKPVLGLVLLVLSNVSSGIVNIIISQKNDIGSPITISSMQLMLGGLLLMLFSWVVEPFRGFDFPAVYYVSLVWLSAISAVAFSIWYLLLQRKGVKVSDLNVWKFLIPVSGALLSWLLVPGEGPDVFALTGMAVIGGALLLYYKKA
ncbi:drug/metabolite transporter (DMT)-like permease [Breznakibacter xylanolyticus]|uniref:Drug/metabolite transporter (DMT)-like permease n=1 Tax=Breznakibacter xylanolyticus TaxID=990 RepID=A0A2W7NI73_9BACT|nr:DMT family transporter [Breznakibacter xylanolyticus]PZX10972.1 drug/metabolite transporter (DMT)-like permease [Breznakibacter xylanolyticus]